ncbi:hypothetical protein BHE74_00033225 [Ensete ventricosum]|nr:hypothetical protein BHE74_00033225 [Ensete ventricosum]
MGTAPAGVPASDRPCRRQLLLAGGLPTGAVPIGVAPAGGCLCSLAAGCCPPSVAPGSHGLAAGWPWLAALASCPGCSRQPFAEDLGHGRPPLSSLPSLQKCNKNT